MTYFCDIMLIELDKMYRAIHLSSMAYNATYPNPRVGAVLSHNGRVIGEGFHKKYGDLHAEEVCIENVSSENKKFIPESTLYVTLEPCNHVGKRPACSELILQHKIGKVVVAATDPNPIVSGSGIAHLRKNGVEVEIGVLAEEAISQNLFFHHFYTQKKPYIILKWAEDATGMIGSSASRIQITSEEASKFTMRWRAETHGILVGAQTAIVDNPKLTNRSGVGIDPVRFLLDPNLRAYASIPRLNLLTQPPSTYIFNTQIENKNEGKIIVSNLNEIPLTEVTKKLHELNILSILVEGGAQTLQAFIDSGIYEEIRVIKSKKLIDGDVLGPRLPENLEINEQIEFPEDTISYYLK